MTDTQPTKDIRLKSGPSILEYIRQFSATEKAVFGLLLAVFSITAIVMAVRVNNMFMAEVPAYGGTLHEGIVGLPRTINPVLYAADVDRDISALVYSGLMRYSDGKLVPDLAQKYSVSSDGLTYSFILKDGLRFQDGSELTTEDIAYTIQKVMDPALKSPRHSDWANIAVQIVSAKEIHFILKEPYAPFLANTTLGIIPKHIWGSTTDDQFILSKYNIEPVGSGPYDVGGVTRDKDNIPTKYRLSTWNGYYGSKPYLSTIEFTFFGDEDKALAAIDNGSIDSLSSVSASEAAGLALDKAQAYTVVASALPRIFGVFFNQNQNAALSDKNVRQALSMVVDRDAMVKQIFRGYGTSLYGPIADGADDDTSSAKAFDATSSLAAAKTLLEKNGWKKDTSTGIYSYQKKGSKAVQSLSFDIYTADTTDLKQTALILKNTWNSMGANVNVKVFESSDLYQNVIRTRKYDALLFGEQIGKDRDFYAFWHSSQRNSPGLNVAMYTNSKVDKILEDLRSSADNATRSAKYRQLGDLITADFPAVFLYSPDFVYVVPKSLHGLELNNITVPSDRFNTVNDWYITTDKVWKIFAKNK